MPEGLKKPRPFYRMGSMKVFITAVLVVLLVATLAWFSFKKHPLKPSTSSRSAKTAGSVVSPERKGPVSVDISGPLSGRGIIRRVIPAYPEWAQEQGVQGTVVLEVSVKSNGDVVSFIPVIQTAHPDLDKLCLEAMLRWRFVDAPAGSNDQTGRITFQFRLSS